MEFVRTPLTWPGDEIGMSEPPFRELGIVQTRSVLYDHLAIDFTHEEHNLPFVITRLQTE